VKGDKNVDVEDGESLDIGVGVSVDLEGGTSMYMLQKVRRKM
jgi:hypothetical protein